MQPPLLPSCKAVQRKQKRLESAAKRQLHTYETYTTGIICIRKMAVHAVRL